MAEFISFRVLNNGVESQLVINLANIAMAQINAEASTVRLHVLMPNGTNNMRLFTLSGQEAINIIAKLEKCT